MILIIAPAMRIETVCVGHIGVFPGCGFTIPLKTLLEFPDGIRIKNIRET